MIHEYIVPRKQTTVSSFLLPRSLASSLVFLCMSQRTSSGQAKKRKKWTPMLVNNRGPAPRGCFLVHNKRFRVFPYSLKVLPWFWCALFPNICFYPGVPSFVFLFFWCSQKVNWKDWLRYNRGTNTTWWFFRLPVLCSKIQVLLSQKQFREEILGVGSYR